MWNSVPCPIWQVKQRWKFQSRFNSFPFICVYSFSLLSLLKYSISSSFDAKLCRIVPIGGDGGDLIHHPNRRSHKKNFFVEMLNLFIIVKNWLKATQFWYRWEEEKDKIHNHAYNYFWTKLHISMEFCGASCITIFYIFLFYLFGFFFGLSFLLNHFIKFDLFLLDFLLNKFMSCRHNFIHCLLNLFFSTLISRHLTSELLILQKTPLGVKKYRELNLNSFHF
jgi:hypothetical protein